jgi:CheY-like chemotaxis protein
MMPEVDGFEVLEAIKNDHVTAGIPVLILTAKDLTPAELTRLKSNHIYKLIQKGDVDLEALLVKVKEMVGLAANEQATGAEHKNKGQTSGNCKKSGLSAETKNKNSHHCILVIEDNPDNMVTLKSVLKGRFQILEAVDGETGFQLARSELPDLVLLDMSLPGMDGFQVVEKIKANTQTRDIVVIALTARAMKGDKEFILQAGCDDYISKPIDPEKLAHTIQAWLEKGETNDEDFGD